MSSSLWATPLAASSGVRYTLLPACRKGVLACGGSGGVVSWGCACGGAADSLPSGGNNSSKELSAPGASSIGTNPRSKLGTLIGLGIGYLVGMGFHACGVEIK